MKVETKKEISVIDVKKQLYKSKEKAKFSHYIAGNLYYTIEIEQGIYQFPISTVDIVKLADMPLKTKGKVKKKTDIEIAYEYDDAKPLYVYNGEKEKYVEATTKELSSDLGTTPFDAEMKGSELNRWIQKAIKSGEFTKIK